MQLRFEPLEGRGKFSWKKLATITFCRPRPPRGIVMPLRHEKNLRRFRQSTGGFWIDAEYRVADAPPKLYSAAEEDEDPTVYIGAWEAESQAMEADAA